MRIAIVSVVPPDQIGVYSGTPYHLSRAIQETWESSVYVHVPYSWDELPPELSRAKEARRGLERIGRVLSRRLQGLDVDAVICQGPPFPIPFLETDKPLVYWHDTLCFALTYWRFGYLLDFEGFKSQYPHFYALDRRVLKKCDLVAFAADWIRDHALACHNLTPEKVCVIPFGANIDAISQETVEESINERSRVPCRLTFLGIEWQRKGLPLAYEVLSRLNATGLNAKLTTIGCDVPKAGPERESGQIGDQSSKDVKQFQRRFHSDPSVDKVGILSKGNPSDCHLLSQILQKTHFLLHPAHFEPFGIAMVEANAFGVPVIATDHYGPQTIVRNGVNGYLFEPGEYVTRACDFIQRQMEDYEAYKSLAQSSFLEYRDRLNWFTGAQKLKERIQELL